MKSLQKGGKTRHLDGECCNIESVYIAKENQLLDHVDEFLGVVGSGVAFHRVVLVLVGKRNEKLLNGGKEKERGLGGRK